MDYENLHFNYDNEPLLKQSTEYLYAKVWQYGDIPSTHRVLDVGCGSGGLAHFVKHKNYVGLDISLSNLKEARTGREGLFVNGSALELPFDDGSFDRIVCCEVLEHFERLDRAAILAEISRVLSTNGKVSISVPNAYYLWCYIPYSLSPMKRRASLDKLGDAFQYGLFDEGHPTFRPHYRFVPSYLKEQIEKDSNLKITKSITTYWYNNRYLKRIPVMLQKEIHKLFTGGLFGSQIVLQCMLDRNGG